MRGFAWLLVAVSMVVACVVAHGEPGAVQVNVTADSVVTVCLVSGARVAAVGTVPKGESGCQLQGVPPGKYRLVASAPMYRSVVREVSVAEGTVMAVTIRIEKFIRKFRESCGRAVGSVKNLGGSPVTDCLLLLIKDKQVVGVTRPERPTGVYELEWYPPGVYTVLVLARGYAPVDYHGIELRAGKSTRLDPVLVPE